MAKIDWNKARGDYVRDPTMSYAKIAFKYGVSETVVKEWAAKQEWQQLREETSRKIAEKLPEKIAESVTEFQARKFYQGKQVTERAMEVINDPGTFISSRTAKELLDIGFKIQTEAMGLDDPKTVVNIQNNTFMSLSDFVGEMHKRRQSRDGESQKVDRTPQDARDPLQ